MRPLLGQLGDASPGPLLRDRQPPAPLSGLSPPESDGISTFYVLKHACFPPPVEDPAPDIMRTLLQ
jgi:hypothetical protein